MYRFITEQAQIVRTYAQGLGKAAVIIPAAFLVSVSIGLCGLGIVFHARETLGAAPSQIGWLVASWSVAYIAGCLVVRPAFDRVPARWLLIGSCILMGSLALGMRAARGLPALFALQVSHAVAASLFWPPIMGWLSANREGAALGRVISRFNVSWSMGNILSPLLCGWLSQRATSLPLAAGAAVVGLAAAYIGGAVAALPRVRDESSALTEETGDEAPDASTRLRFAGWAGAVVANFGSGILRSVFPVAGVEVLAFSKSAVGALLLVCAACGTVTFLVLGATRRWHFRVGPMLAGQVVGAAAYAALPAARSAWPLAVLFSALGVSQGMAYMASIFHGVSGSRRRDRRMAIHETMLSCGIVSGPVLGGIAFERRGLAFVWWLCLAVMLAGGALQSLLCAWAVRRDRTDARDQGGPQSGIEAQ